MPRFQLSLALALCSMAAFFSAADSSTTYAQQSAEQYPSRQIRIVAPFAPGATTDTLARILAQHMQIAWNQPVVVENRPGASGAVGTASVVSAPADGSTLIVVTSGHVINPVLTKVAFDPIADFTPIVLLTSIPNLLVVHPSVPVASVADFVKMVKENPGKLTYGTSGAGGSSHITAEVFKHVAGIDMQHVSYRGGALAIADLVAGHIKIAMSTVPTAIGFVQTGQARAIAVTSPKRSPALPNVTTLSEAGFPDILLVEWFALAAPANVPLAIRRKINAEVTRIMAIPDVKAKLEGQGIAYDGGTVEFLDEFMRAEAAKWRRLIKRAGIKSE